MFHKHRKNNNINRLHERYFRIMCSNKRSSFENLLGNNISISIHKINFLFLAFKRLTYFRQLFPFYTLRKHKKPRFWKKNIGLKRAKVNQSVLPFSLAIPDILYSRHPRIVDRFHETGLRLIEKHLYKREIYYSRPYFFVTK